MRNALVLGLTVLAMVAVHDRFASAGDAYEADWDSLRKHEPAPEWFRDAKFGIYFHWGVYCVPAFGSEWYPRNMHLKNRPEYKHHIETYGDPTEVGYPDFVPKFRAEKFDAEEWAALFEKAGARFAGPVAEHHDGFAMWDSDQTPWNAADMGPRRDVTGELAKALRRRGMKLVATFHHARNSLWRKEDGNWTGHYQGVKENFPSLLDDPKRAIMYGYMPREKFLDMWRGKLFEVIDNYRPDLIWFDSWLNEIPEAYQTSFLAYYLNRADEWGKEVVVTYKQEDLPQDIGVLDLEKGRMNQLTEFTWLTDDTISLGSWCYTQDLRIKPLRQVLHVLIDIVSKNGQLLLNISPKADGTIPDEQRDVLLGIGKWLEICGEAIYNTRPWIAFGEGPTRLKEGGGFVHRRGGYLQYTAEDIRYTRSKDGKTLYAILMGWPTDDVTLRCVQVNRTGANARVELIGHDGSLAYRVNEHKQPVIEMPSLAPGQRPCKYAFALKLSGFDFQASPEVAFMSEDAVTLSADQAVLDGEKIGTEQKDGRTNIGFWDNAGESVHWLLRIGKAGAYQMRGEFAAVGQSALRLRVGDRQRRFEVPATGGWDRPAKVAIGRLTFDAPGVYHVVLGPANPKNWRAVNVWQLQFAPVRK